MLFGRIGGRTLLYSVAHIKYNDQWEQSSIWNIRKPEWTRTQKKRTTQSIWIGARKLTGGWPHYEYISNTSIYVNEGDNNIKQK